MAWLFLQENVQVQYLQKIALRAENPYGPRQYGFAVFSALAIFCCHWGSTFSGRWHGYWCQCRCHFHLTFISLFCLLNGNGNFGRIAIRAHHLIQEAQRIELIMQIIAWNGNMHVYISGVLTHRNIVLDVTPEGGKVEVWEQLGPKHSRR